jgi:hypothetical protein
MTLPNAFIVGVNKAGTTSIFNALVAAPDVHGSRTKETHYFDPVTFGRALPPLSDYEEQFAGWDAEPVVLEATPSYFYGGAPLAAAIHAVSPHAKVVIILRDPRERAFSWWRFCKTRLLLAPEVTFEDYVGQCEARGLEPETDEDSVGWRGLSGGRYAEWLPDWQAEFADDLLVEFYEDLAASPGPMLERIARHFGAAGHAIAVPSDNTSTDVVNLGLQRAALRINRRLELLWRRFPALKSRLRSVYYLLNARRSQATLSVPMRRRLTDYFADSNQALRGLGLHLPASWETSA